MIFFPLEQFLDALKGFSGSVKANCVAPQKWH
jgi:hypothetical protein